MKIYYLYKIQIIKGQYINRRASLCHKPSKDKNMFWNLGFFPMIKKAKEIKLRIKNITLEIPKKVSLDSNCKRARTKGANWRAANPKAEPILCILEERIPSSLFSFKVKRPDIISSPIPYRKNKSKRVRARDCSREL